MTVADGTPYTTNAGRPRSGQRDQDPARFVVARHIRAQLYKAALESGRFPMMTARRLRNIVVECFAPRYSCRARRQPAHLKRLAPALSTAELTQLMLVFTCRANPILGDFVRRCTGLRYAGGYAHHE